MWVFVYIYAVIVTDIYRIICVFSLNIFFLGTSAVKFPLRKMALRMSRCQTRSLETFRLRPPLLFLKLCLMCPCKRRSQTARVIMRWIWINQPHFATKMRGWLTMT